MYKLLFTQVLARLPAETAHRLAFGLIRAVMAVPGVAATFRRWLQPTDPALRMNVLGLDLPGPLGLAAGFDKNAEGVDAMAALGFAYRRGRHPHRPGTARQSHAADVPADRRPRAGQPHGVQQPRCGRGGAATEPTPGTAVQDAFHPVGVNIGKTKVVPEAGAVADYVASARLLAGVADYLVVNVSSPNTPGLRDLQAVEHLRPLLAGVRAALDEAADRRVPLLVKIAPDLADGDVDAVADLALDLGIDGIIATNTTIGRNGLRSDSAAVEAAGAGGLSGAPLKERSLEVLARLRARVGDRLVLVAAGGVEDAEDAWQRITAGASLVQAYTGFIYGGPFWPRRLHRELAARMRAAGYSSIAEAVGTANRPHP